jgi:hypothetical protein
MAPAAPVAFGAEDPFAVPFAVPLALLPLVLVAAAALPLLEASFADADAVELAVPTVVLAGV